jgi:hypothetical protein
MIPLIWRNNAYNEIIAHIVPETDIEGCGAGCDIGFEFILSRWEIA